MSDREPPRLPIVLLEHLVPGSEPLAGDLVETFRRRPSTLWLWWQVLVAVGAAWLRRSDEIRPLVLVDEQPAEAIERAHDTALRFRSVNLTASPVAGVGGLGFLVLALIVTAVVPAAWWALLVAPAAGLLLGIALIVVHQTNTCSRASHR